MHDLTVARRYARAFYEEAAAGGLLAQAEDDVALLRQTLSASRALRQLFESPVVPREKKEAIAAQLFGARVAPLTLRFLHLLIGAKREAALPAILDAFDRRRDAEAGIAEAHVRTALPLGPADEAELTRALEAKVGKKIRLTAQLDPSLIGGVVVRIGDTVYDGSVRRKLESLHEQFGGAALSTN